ncbi:Reticulon-like protein B5 [Vitis vinifera]|uniref:Reticulon-like protein B5 n=1 Tax=Vitis vinifera TaxID=29760 RepID=A0A438HZL2_VITVI|nr:Reticulon-like protein B5 [Vitis vinifera]
MYFFGAVARKWGEARELEKGKRLDKKELGQRRKENRERFLSRGRAKKLSGGGANPTPGSTLGSRAASESLLEKITDELQGHDSSSSESVSDPNKTTSSSSVKAKDFRLFGREKLVHIVLGGGKHTDVFL